MSDNGSNRARRVFLSKAGAAVAGLGAVFGARTLPAAAQGAGTGSRFQAARHAEDDWLDQMPGVHRTVIDCPTADGFGRALFFGNNIFGANASGYGLKDTDVALVIVVRHESTPFAFNDAMWAKYSEPMSNQAQKKDPKTNAAPTINMFLASGYGGGLTNRNTTLGRLLDRGAHLAVCQLATRGMSGQIARATGQTADDVYKELTSNLVDPGRSHMVPAGIVAVNRAQERGYTFSFVD
jgi:hypothetical protein